MDAFCSPGFVAYILLKIRYMWIHVALLVGNVEANN